MVASWQIVYHLQEEKVCGKTLGDVFQGYEIHEFHSQTQPMGLYQSYAGAGNGIVFSQNVLEGQSGIVFADEQPYIEQV